MENDNNSDDDGAGLLSLDSQLCFALYAATHAVTKTYRIKLSELGLTYTQYLVLLVLWERDGLKISEIGEELKLDSGTITPLIRRLESMEIVRRERSKEDERVVKVFLCEKGLAPKMSVLEVRKFVGESLQMSQSEILALRANLMRVVDTLEKVNADRNDDVIQITEKPKKTKAQA